MSETTPIPRPESRVGEFDWNRAPKLLYSSAFNLVLSAKKNPVLNEGLQMVMTLKRRETIIMAQQMMVEHEEDYIKEHGEDAMFTRKGLANNRKKLRRYNAKKTALVKDYGKRKSANPALQTAYIEVEAEFTRMFDLIAHQQQKMDLLTQAAYQMHLLKLLDYYLNYG